MTDSCVPTPYAILRTVLWMLKPLLLDGNSLDDRLLDGAIGLLRVRDRLLLLRVFVNNLRFRDHERG